MSIPASWYFVARADALTVGGRSLEVVAGDRLLELWREADGQVRGRAAGHVIELSERGSLLFAWLGGGEPSFEIAEFDSVDWTPLQMFHVDLPTSPSVIMRDLADVEHFSSVHRYVGVEVTEPLRFEGATYTTAIAFGWDTGIPHTYLPARFRARVEGLGVQRTEVETLAGYLHTRHLILPTPRLSRVTRVHAASSVKIERRFGRLEVGKAYALAAWVARSFRRGLERDARVWTGPRRSPSPGPNHGWQQFQRWSEQFEASAASE